ncbi:MAG TPA: hypothetical protein VIZ43_19620 [Trebonia sp.]
MDVTADASGLAEKALIADEYVEPFSSNATRLLFGVAGLKKAFQLVVICATAPVEPLAGALGEAGAEGDAGALGAVVADEEELELLLEQAVTAVTNTRPSTGAR